MENKCFFVVSQFFFHMFNKYESVFFVQFPSFFVRQFNKTAGTRVIMNDIHKVHLFSSPKAHNSFSQSKAVRFSLEARSFNTYFGKYVCIENTNNLTIKPTIFLDVVKRKWNSIRRINVEFYFNKSIKNDVIMNIIMKNINE